MAPLTFLAPGPPFCKAITASLHSKQKKAKKPNKVFDANHTKKKPPESKRCALIFSNLHLLDLHDIIILQISLQKSKSKRSEHYLSFCYSNATSVSRTRARNE